MSHHWGYVSAVVSAILFGVSSTLNKIALENTNPTVTAGIIYFIAGIFLFAIYLSPLHKKILAKLDTSETESKITKKDYRILALVIICGSITAPLLLLNGLNQTTAINASLLLNGEALFNCFHFFKRALFKTGVHRDSDVACGRCFLNHKRSISETNFYRERYR